MYPVEARDTKIEIPLIDIGRALLGHEDFYFSDTIVGYAGVIVPVGTLYLEISLFEELKGLRLEAAGSAIEIMPLLSGAEKPLIYELKKIQKFNRINE